MVPAFGDNIRRFEGNISDMKRLAGHDLEDVLQVRCLLMLKIQYLLRYLSVLFPASKAYILSHTTAL